MRNAESGPGPNTWKMFQDQKMEPKEARACAAHPHMAIRERTIDGRSQRNEMSDALWTTWELEIQRI